MKSKYDGVRMHGHWTGYPCNAQAKYPFGLKHYCGNHLVIAMNEPERFAKAIATKERRRGKGN
jgi:hypothetical protein